MNFKKILTEIKAEIKGSGFPDHLIFDNNNKLIGDKIKGTEWEQVFKEILVAIKKQNLGRLFSAEKEPMDVFGSSPTGRVYMQDDNGRKYYFDTVSKKIYNRK